MVDNNFLYNNLGSSRDIEDGHRKNSQECYTFLVLYPLLDQQLEEEEFLLVNSKNEE